MRWQAVAESWFIGMFCSPSKLRSLSVYSAMGKSRSVTITAAYLLATRPELTPQTALALIKETRPGAEPNSGFMEQLSLWHKAGCPEDVESHPLYQRWLFNAEVEMSAAIGRAPDRLRFEDEEIAVVKEALGDSGKAPTNPKQRNLRCKRCRTLLGTEDYVVTHVAKESKKNETTVDMSSLPLPNPEAALESLTDVKCGHYFIQPLSWMRPTLETQELEGRLDCPNQKCKAHVGRWNWKGLRCSCGVWVTPAFALQKGRVDVLSPEVERGRGAALAGVRMPPGMAIRMPPGGRGENL